MLALSMQRRRSLSSAGLQRVCACNAMTDRTSTLRVSRHVCACMRTLGFAVLFGLAMANMASAASFEVLGNHVMVRSDGAQAVAYQLGDATSPVRVLSEGPSGTTQRDVP